MTTHASAKDSEKGRVNVKYRSVSPSSHSLGCGRGIKGYISFSATPSLLLTYCCNFSLFTILLKLQAEGDQENSRIEKGGEHEKATCLQGKVLMSIIGGIFLSLILIFLFWSLSTILSLLCVHFVVILHPPNSATLASIFFMF